MTVDKKPNNPCTSKEFEQFKSIHKDFEDRSNLSERKRTELAEQLKYFWPALVTIGSKLNISFDDRDPYILNKLIFGDDVGTFLSNASLPHNGQWKVAELDIQLTHRKSKEAERKFYLVMIRLREHFDKQAEAISPGQTKSQIKQAKVPTKEQPWADVAPEYLSNSKAIKLADGRISIKKLGKLLKPNGTMRYMRRGHRCKVHIGDFTEYIKTLGPDMFSEEMFSKYYEGVEARKEEERHTKPSRE
jgi:hypothetical protein